LDRDSTTFIGRLLYSRWRLSLKPSSHLRGEPSKIIKASN